jgi:hypothetical protein
MSIKNSQWYSDPTHGQSGSQPLVASSDPPNTCTYGTPGDKLSWIICNGNNPGQLGGGSCSYPVSLQSPQPTPTSILESPQPTPSLTFLPDLENIAPSPQPSKYKRRRRYSRVPTSVPTQHIDNEPGPSPPTPAPSIVFDLSSAPTRFPSQPVTSQPSQNPILSPTISTTQPVTPSSPTDYPTTQPSPTSNPTNSPTTAPSSYPSNSPSSYPTSHPTLALTPLPTDYPTNSPTTAPSSYPSNSPSSYPTSHPTLSLTPLPTSHPTHPPTSHPTLSLTPLPTSHPTHPPTSPPTHPVSPSPTSHPTHPPTVDTNKFGLPCGPDNYVAGLGGGGSCGICTDTCGNDNPLVLGYFGIAGGSSGVSTISNNNGANTYCGQSLVCCGPKFDNSGGVFVKNSKWFTDPPHGLPGSQPPVASSDPPTACSYGVAGDASTWILCTGNDPTQVPFETCTFPI